MTMARQYSTRPRAVAKRVSTALAGGGDRHRKAEERRDDICHTFHTWFAALSAYSWLAQRYGISESTVRSIHRQHCWLKPRSQ